jgi:hypothetical protein
MIRSIAIVAVCFMAFGMANTKLVHCSRLDRHYPAALSNYFEARGFPLAWLASGAGTCGALPGIRGRILWPEFLASALFAVFLPAGIYLASKRHGRSL